MRKSRALCALGPMIAISALFGGTPSAGASERCTAETALGRVRFPTEGVGIGNVVLTPEGLAIGGASLDVLLCPGDRLSVKVPPYPRIVLKGAPQQIKAEAKCYGFTPEGRVKDADSCDRLVLTDPNFFERIATLVADLFNQTDNLVQAVGMGGGGDLHPAVPGLLNGRAEITSRSHLLLPIYCGCDAKVEARILQKGRELATGQVARTSLRAVDSKGRAIGPEFLPDHMIGFHISPSHALEPGSAEIEIRVDAQIRRFAFTVVRETGLRSGHGRNAKGRSSALLTLYEGWLATDRLGWEAFMAAEDLDPTITADPNLMANVHNWARQ